MPEPIENMLVLVVSVLVHISVATPALSPTEIFQHSIVVLLLKLIVSETFSVTPSFIWIVYSIGLFEESLFGIAFNVFTALETVASGA